MTEQLTEAEQAYVVERTLAGKKVHPPKRPCIVCGHKTQKRCWRQYHRVTVTGRYEKHVPVKPCGPVCGKCERDHRYIAHLSVNLPKKCEASYKGKPCKGRFSSGRCVGCRAVVCSKHRHNEKCPICSAKPWKHTNDLLPEEQVA